MADPNGNDADLERPSTGKAQVQPRLAPLDHVRNLYHDAEEILPADRKIKKKQDLIKAVRDISAHRKRVSARAPSSVVDRGPLIGAPVMSMATTDPSDEPEDTMSRTLRDLESSVHRNTRRLNDMRRMVSEKRSSVRNLRSRLERLRTENASLTPGATAEDKRVQELEAEVKAIRGRVEEKEYQKRQYEHMAKRLRDNHVAYDSHLKAMDDALEVATKELNEVRAYIRQLEGSRAQAEADLVSMERKALSAQEKRSKKLAERQAELAAAKKTEQWRKQRESVRAELAAELAGDMSKEQEEQLLAAREAKERQYLALQADRREREARAQVLQDAFQKIRAVTGVYSLEGMIDRFIGQAASRDAIKAEREAAEVRLQAAKAAADRAEEDLALLRASGADRAARETDEAVEEIVGGGGEDLEFAAVERQAVEAKAHLKRLRTAADRLERVIVSVRQGAAGLAQRLEPFEELIRAAGRPVDEVGAAPGTDGEEAEDEDEDAFLTQEDRDILAEVLADDDTAAELRKAKRRRQTGAWSDEDTDDEIDNDKQQQHIAFSETQQSSERKSPQNQQSSGRKSPQNQQSSGSSPPQNQQATPSKKQSPAKTSSPEDAMEQQIRRETMLQAAATAAAALGAAGGGETALVRAGAGSAAVDVRRQGKEAYRMLRRALRRLKRLVVLVDEAANRDARGRAAAMPESESSTTSPRQLALPAVDTSHRDHRPLSAAEASTRISGLAEAVAASLPLEDPVPHPSNVRVRASGVAAGPGPMGESSKDVKLRMAQSHLEHSLNLPSDEDSDREDAASRSPREDVSEAGSRQEQDLAQTVIEAELEQANLPSSIAQSPPKFGTRPVPALGGAARHAVVDRDTIKRASLARVRAEARKFAEEERRERLKEKIAIDDERRKSVQRLLKAHPEPKGMSFLTRKPNLM